jgi:hypothetical protein
VCLHGSNGSNVSINLRTGPFLLPGEVLHAKVIIKSHPGEALGAPLVVRWWKDGKRLCMSNQTASWLARIRCPGLDLRISRLTQKDSGQYRAVIDGVAQSAPVSVYVRWISLLITAGIEITSRATSLQVSHENIFDSSNF